MHSEIQVRFFMLACWDLYDRNADVFEVSEPKT
jgi:hypothetical protein